MAKRGEGDGSTSPSGGTFNYGRDGVAEGSQRGLVGWGSLAAIQPKAEDFGKNKSMLGIVANREESDAARVEGGLVQARGESSGDGANTGV